MDLLFIENRELLDLYSLFLSVCLSVSVSLSLVQSPDGVAVSLKRKCSQMFLKIEGERRN